MESVITPVFDTLIEYLAEKATPEEILAFQLSEDTQERARELLEANSEGSLSIMDRIELDQLIHFDRLMMRLKARAYRNLTK